jgi:ketosteroid isomerase-like protein
LVGWPNKILLNIVAGLKVSSSMPTRERVQAFVACVVSGDHVRAIAEFYHTDATMQENGKPPRLGRAALMAHEAAALARLKSMHTHSHPVVLVDGDHVVIRWTFDGTDQSGVTRRLEELAFQRWQGEHVIEERFFYDTATAWQVVVEPQA